MQYYLNPSAPHPAYSYQPAELSYPDLATNVLTAEARYRAALAEVRAAEEEYAVRVALAREEAVRRERALAMQAEVERLQRARHLQLHRRQAIPSALAAPPAHYRTSYPYPYQPGTARPMTIPLTPRLSRPSQYELDEQAVDLTDLSRYLIPPSHASASRPRAFHPEVPASPQKLAQHDEEAAAMQDVLDFLYGAGSHSDFDLVCSCPSSPSALHPYASLQPHSTPDAKGQGKAPESDTLQARLEQRLQGESDTEIAATLRTLLFGLGDRAAGASSSKVRLDGPYRAPTPAPSSAYTETPTFAPRPKSAPVPPASRTPSLVPSPLTAIRTIRTTLLNLRAPPAADTDAVHLYTHVLEGMLAKLDAVESDGDEEVRGVRRDVVREVEAALAVYDKEKERGEVNSEEEAVEEGRADVKEKVEVLVAEAVAVVPDTAEVERLDDAPAVEEALPVEETSASDADAHVPTAVELVPTAADESTNAVAEPAMPAESTSASTDLPTADAPTAVPEIAAMPSRAPSPAPSSSPASLPGSLPSPLPVPSSPIASNPTPEHFLASLSHAHFTFPPRPSQSSPEPAHQEDDAVLVYGEVSGSEPESEGEARNGSADEWSEVEA